LLSATPWTSHTVRFQVLDGAAADEDLSEILARLGEARQQGSLLFPATARRAMFPAPITTSLGRQTLASTRRRFFAGEITGCGRNMCTASTASILAGLSARIG